MAGTVQPAVKPMLTREDIDDILQVFADSHFARMQVEAGPVRIAVNRYPQQEEEPIRSAEDIVQVTAPILGSFQAGSEAGAPAFVSVGTAVEPDTTVAMIKVMQKLTSVKAGVAGTIVEILARDGDLVEFRQPLFRVSAPPAAA